MMKTPLDYVLMALLLAGILLSIWFYFFRGFTIKGVLDLFADSPGKVTRGSAALNKEPAYVPVIRDTNVTTMAEKINRAPIKIPTSRNAPSFRQLIMTMMAEANESGLSLQRFTEQLYALYMHERMHISFQVGPEGEEYTVTSEDIERLGHVFAAISTYAKMRGVSGSKHSLIQETSNFLTDAASIKTIKSAIEQTRGRAHFNERGEAMMDAVIMFFTAYLPNNLNAVGNKTVHSLFMTVGIKEFFEKNMVEYERRAESRKNHERHSTRSSGQRRRNNRAKNNRR